MSFCPVCRSEYVEGIVKCADCGAQLVAELPPLHEPGDTDVELVEIWRAADEMEAQIIRGALDGAGMKCMLRGEALRHTHGFTVDGLAEVRILVPPEDAERAREIIVQARNSQSSS